MKRALVTGGAGDIGRAICARLAEAGLHVVVHAYRGRERAEAVAEDIAKSGGSAEVVLFNAADHGRARSVLEDLVESGPIQVLVNNAGLHADAPMAGMSHDQWSDVVDVNLNGVFNVTQPLLLPMMQTRWGRIVNVSSVAAVLGNRGQANYAAAKAGVHGLTKTLAIELATRGITVNTVAPGIIASAMTDTAFDSTAIKALVPMGRAGLPNEVAAVVAFLVSEEASYVSGQLIGVNGAMA